MTPAQIRARSILDEMPACGGYSKITPHVLALCILLEDAHFPTVGEAAAELGVGVATASLAAAEAVAAGFVSRHRGLRGHQNSISLALTAKGAVMRKRRRGNRGCAALAADARSS